jgi:hypothetical protein
MARELPPQSRELEIVQGAPELIDSPIKGIDLASLNVLTAVGLGILVGQQAIRQVLNPGTPGPLGNRNDRR